MNELKMMSGIQGPNGVMGTKIIVRFLQATKTTMTTEAKSIQA
jgi:hypothetical protein